MASTATTGDADAGSWSWKAQSAAVTGAARTAPGFWGGADSEVWRAVAAEVAADKRRSSPRLGDRGLEEEISGGSDGQLQGEQPRRIRRKVAANRCKLHDDQFEAQGDTDQDVDLLNKRNESLRLQLALKTKQFELEQNRRLQLELILKTKENESLLKQNEELKAENEQMKKTAKPPRARRFCRSYRSYEFHDSRN